MGSISSLLYTLKVLNSFCECHFKVPLLPRSGEWNSYITNSEASLPKWKIRRVEHGRLYEDDLLRGKLFAPFD